MPNDHTATNVRNVPGCQEQYSYTVYGLRLTSDRPIPGLNLRESSEDRSTDLLVRFNATELQFPQDYPPDETVWYTSDIQDERGKPALTIWKRRSSGEYQIRYSHGLTFVVDAGIANVTIRCDKPMAADDVAAFLLGPVLGIVLRLRGVTCLHASAVVAGGRAIAFMGTPTAGKSTTAALFAQKGHSVLSDDIVALLEREDSFYVLPAYPYLNLLPQTLEMLTGSTDCTMMESETVDKLRIPLDVNGAKFQREALPLAAIYLLGGRSVEARVPFLDRLTPRSALVSLIANTYGNTILDASMRAQEFSVLGQLAKSVPVGRVVTCEDNPQLTSLYELISEDLARIMA